MSKRFLAVYVTLIAIGLAAPPGAAGENKKIQISNFKFGILGFFSARSAEKFLGCF